MTKKDKVISPASYQLGHGYNEVVNSIDKVSANIVYREINGFKYFDIVVKFNDRVFLVKPWGIYSQKTLNVYKWLLTHAGLDLLQDSQEAST